MKREAIILTVSCLLILLFTYAAASKLAELEQFRIQIYQITYLRPFTAIISIAVPAVEIVISALLLFAATRRIGLYSSFILMAIFSIYIAILLTFSPHLPCACGGAIQNLSWSQHLMVNLGFTGLALWACILQKKEQRNQVNGMVSQAN